MYLNTLSMYYHKCRAVEELIIELSTFFDFFSIFTDEKNLHKILHGRLIRMLPSVQCVPVYPVPVQSQV